ncbi:MAG: adaptor protein MecA [Eubacterium sp.]
MMRQANDDFGFDVSNIPLMVEATPIPSDGIVLVITKVPNQDGWSSLSFIVFQRFS